MKHYIFRVVKRMGYGIPSLYSSTGSFLNSSEYSYSIEDQKGSELEAIASTLVGAEALMMHNTRWLFVSVWNVTVGEKMDADTPTLVLFPVKWNTYIEDTPGEEAKWTLERSYWSKKWTNKASPLITREFFVQWDAEFQTTTNCAVADVFTGLTLAKERRGGRAKYLSFLNCLTCYDFYFDHEGFLRLRSDGFIHDRIAAFNSCLKRIEQWESGIYINSDGIVCEGEALKHDWSAVCATEYSQRRKQVVENAVAHGERVRVVEQIIRELFVFYEFSVGAGNPSRTGVDYPLYQTQYAHPPYYGNPPVTIRDGVMYYWRVLLEYIRETIQSTLFLEHIDPREHYPLDDYAFGLIYKSQTLVDIAKGSRYSIIKLNEFIEYFREVQPNIHVTPIWRSVDNHWPEWWVYVDNVVVAKEFLIADTTVRKLRWNRMLDDTQENWDWWKSHGIEKLKTMQRSVNILGIFEKFSTLKMADLSSATAKPMKRKHLKLTGWAKVLHEFQENVRSNSYNTHILGLSAKGALVGDKANLERAPRGTMSFIPPKQGGKLAFPHMHAILFDMTPFVDDLRVKVEVVFPPPPPVLKPKRALVWDHTVHPLDADLEREEFCALRESMEENARAVAHPAADIIILVLKDTGQWPPDDNAGKAIEVAVHLAIDEAVNKINPCDDPKEHLLGDLANALPPQFAYIVKKVLHDMGVS